MKIYLIAPNPTLSDNRLLDDKPVQSEDRYALVAASGITTVAAYFPEEFEIRLCDEVIEDIDFETPFDVIALSMNVGQAARGLEIARKFRKMGRTVIMGGAHVTLAPEVFEGEADSLVIGEFETICETVTSDLLAGTLKPRYTGTKADLSKARIPRWDLYRNDRTIWGSVQTSRGCPFECEFCDVIQYLGRKQRHKPPELVIAELDEVYKHGYRQIYLSDDNFTVYRKRTHALLDALEEWNGRGGRDPVNLSTQTSIDLARDKDLMAQCNRAGLRDLFVGIETSNEEALKETKKRQNLHQDLVAQCEKMVTSGLIVNSGMIVGFDSDHLDCFDRQFAFGMSLPVVNFRVSVLVAPVSTPLFARMQAEGRLVEDPNTVGAFLDLWTNIEPMNMTRTQLAEGAAWLVHSLLDPDNVIERFERVAALLGAAPEHLRVSKPTNYRGTGAGGTLSILRNAARDAGGRRVIEAVDALVKARPEIGKDLISVLASYLNFYLSTQRLEQRRSASEHAISRANTPSTSVRA